MDRLTRRDENGEPALIGKFSAERITDVLPTLSAMLFHDMLNRLMQYEDAEESEAIVRVVRCKDCQYGETLNSENFLCKMHSEEPDQISTGYNLVMEPDDYCSYGESRAEMEAEATQQSRDSGA